MAMDIDTIQLTRELNEHPELFLQEGARRNLLWFAQYMQPSFQATEFHKAYYRVLDMFAKRQIKKLIVQAPPQHGKALHECTPVLTTKGWKCHKDLMPGDYVFGIDGKPKAVQWNSGVYKCDVPEGYTNLIFVRMNPSSSDNSWEDGVKWGQTGDLKVPSGNDVCFVLEANSWDAGSWTSYPPTGDVEPNPGTPGEDIETAGTIYMRANSNWLEAGARFAAYFFEGANNVWVSMVADVEANVFKCDVPSGFSNVIFVRMNPAVSENRWNTDTDTDTTKPVWNQTADLFVPGAGSTSICYVVTPGTWGEEGYWTTYPPVVTDPEPENPAPDTQPNMLYLNPWQWTSDGARLEAYFFGNGDTWVTMTDSDKDGCYECEIPDGFANVIFVRMDPAKPEHSWDSKWNQTEDQVIASGMNCFTITSWDGGQDGKSKGTWSTK